MVPVVVYIGVDVRMSLAGKSRHHSRLHFPGLRSIKYAGWHKKVTDTFSPYPLEAKVEITITRRCNLNCGMCIRPTLPTFKDMTYKHLNYILRELRDVSVFSPHGYGEPLVHPFFLDLMKKVSDKGHKIHLTTNGTLLTKKLAKTFLTHSKPFKITLSIDAGEKEKYEWIRKGANFETLKENVSSLMDIRNRYKIPTRVIIACTYGKWNEEQIIPLSRFAYNTGVDAVTFSDLTIHGVGLATENNIVREVSEDLSRAKKYFGRKVKIGYTVAKPKLKDPRCLRPWANTFIQVNGDVFPCTDNLDYKLGNIFETPFKEIWNGSKMVEFRKRFKTNPIGFCPKCPSY